eukprot:gene15610-21715_t
MLASKGVSQISKVARPCTLRLAPFRSFRSVLPVRASSEASASEAAVPGAAPAPPTLSYPPIPSGGPDDYVPDDEFSISKVSFGSILVPTGSVLLFFGFGAYFQLWGGGDLSSVALVYGLPATLLGFALSYAQLDPVDCKTNKAALALRDAQMTDIQKQVRDDTTRYRYGDEAHLEEALDRIWRIGKSGGIPRKFSPVLTGLREEVIDGRYALILQFASKLEDDKWIAKEDKYKQFFGPGIVVETSRTGTASVEVALITDGSGAGRGGGERPEVLPQLMPGLKARQSRKFE